MRSRELLHKRESTFSSLQSIHLEKQESEPYDLEKERQISELREAILTLSQPDKSIILLFLERLSYREIAEIIGVTENNIAVRIKRIKEKLGKTLKTINHE